MKLGILTYQRAHNYGALLQAYALKTYLKSLGHQTEMIDYWPDYHKEDYALIPYFKSRSFLGKIKAILLFLLGYKRIIKRKNGYGQFMSEHLNLSDNPLYSMEREMKEIEYDAVVYGSDQIWRRSNYPLFKGFSDVFFGADLIEVKRKITYGASMGVIDVDLKDKDYLKRMLRNFNAISVREEELKLLVDDIIEDNVSLVLDPVFLLKKEEWAMLHTRVIPFFQEKYIFFYQLMPSKESIDFVQRLEEFYGYKVVETRGRVEPMLFGNRYFQTASPLDFLMLIQNAEIVVSTSFHGVAFSLLFEKQFYALGMNNNSGRVQSLLNKLNISERLLANTNQVSFEEKINYQSVNLRKQELISQSKNYLIRALNNF
jgi:hypothetical protein